MDILQASIEELTTKQALYVSAFAMVPETLMRVHQNLKTELVQTAVEFAVVKRKFSQMKAEENANEKNA